LKGKKEGVIKPSHSHREEKGGGGKEGSLFIIGGGVVFGEKEKPTLRGKKRETAFLVVLLKREPGVAGKREDYGLVLKRKRGHLKVPRLQGGKI